GAQKKHKIRVIAILLLLGVPGWCGNHTHTGCTERRRLVCPDKMQENKHKKHKKTHCYCCCCLHIENRSGLRSYFSKYPKNKSWKHRTFADAMDPLLIYPRLF
ncbi:unnamed protein product, partial [Ectocarpus sp. 12 AP-2014]